MHKRTYIFYTQGDLSVQEKHIDKEKSYFQFMRGDSKDLTLTLDELKDLKCLIDEILGDKKCPTK